MQDAFEASDGTIDSAAQSTASKAFCASPFYIGGNLGCPDISHRGWYSVNISSNTNCVLLANTVMQRRDLGSRLYSNMLGDLYIVGKTMD